jgi:hypothetical protein
VIGVAVSAVLAAFAWREDWKYERVLWRLDSGDVAGARRAMAAVGADVPERWSKVWQHVRDDLDAAVEIAPDATNWASARPRFAVGAWRRGVDTLLANGPAAARRWFALAAEVDDDDRVMRHLLYEFCRAADEGDTQRVRETRDLVRRRGVPKGLEVVFRADDEGR